MFTPQQAARNSLIKQALRLEGGRQNARIGRDMSQIITIDGLSGVGKSTVAGQVARKLGYQHIDTGATYRAIAWKAMRNCIDSEEIDCLILLAERTHIELSMHPTISMLSVAVDGLEITTEIRADDVTVFATVISKISEVRHLLARLQRQMVADCEYGVVIEGRDTGAVVCPEAQTKIVLAASPEERARRRHGELHGRGLDVDLHRLLANHQARDAWLELANGSPLVTAAEAIVIQTDHLSIEKVVREIISIHRTSR